MTRLKLNKEQLFRIIESIEEDENIEEVTGASSSGSFVGPLGDSPIRKPNITDELISDGEEDSVCDEDNDLTEANYGQDIITQHLTGAPKKTKSGTIKKVKRNVYNFKDGTKDKNCTLCRFYQKETTNCELIYGKVTKNGLCDNFKLKSTNEMSSGAYDVPFGGASKDGNKVKTEPMIKGGKVLTKESFIKGLSKLKVKLTEHQLNVIKKVYKVIISENDVLPNSDGGFVKIDDCTKLNNNKEAQNGGCSIGAVDNVVTTTSKPKE